jgi:hypothetical protein
MYSCIRHFIEVFKPFHHSVISKTKLMQNFCLIGYDIQQIDYKILDIARIFDCLFKFFVLKLGTDRHVDINDKTYSI